MAVGSPSPLVLTGRGSKPKVLHRDPHPAEGTNRGGAIPPKMKKQALRARSKQDVRMTDRSEKGIREHSQPVLNEAQTPLRHQRQQSAPNLHRNTKSAQSAHNRREKEWIAGFDALEGLHHGQIQVRLDSEDQFTTFLKWVRGKTFHAITLNNSVAGFERDFQTLYSLGLTEDCRDEPSAGYLQLLRQEYAAFPGIADLLRVLPDLQSLDISRCDPSEPDLLKLLYGLKDDRFRLTSLQADHLYWGDRPVVESLLSYLSGPTCLEKLSIKSATGFKLTPHGLLKALRTNAGLKEVSLSISGKKGAVDPEDIALTIFLNPSLKKLSVRTTRFISSAENLLGGEGAVDFHANELVIYHFMSAFVKNTTLEELSIRGTALPAAIIHSMADSIGENSAIQAIHLDESEENRAALQRLQSLVGQRINATSTSGLMPVLQISGSAR